MHLKYDRNPIKVCGIIICHALLSKMHNIYCACYGTCSFYSQLNSQDIFPLFPLAGIWHGGVLMRGCRETTFALKRHKSRLVTRRRMRIISKRGTYVMCTSMKVFDGVTWAKIFFDVYPNFTHHQEVCLRYVYVHCAYNADIDIATWILRRRQSCVVLLMCYKCNMYAINVWYFYESQENALYIYYFSVHLTKFLEFRLLVDLTWLTWLANKWHK